MNNLSTNDVTDEQQNSIQELRDNVSQTSKWRRVLLTALPIQVFIIFNFKIQYYMFRLC